MNFAIIDDNELQRNMIIEIIKNKMMNNKIDYGLFSFNDYNNKVLDYIKNDNRDTVYVLDLELPSGDGIDLARIIREKYNNWVSPIIIITAHIALYYDVYKQRLQILDFIGKCQDIRSSLSENIDICIRMLNKERVYRYTYKGIEYAININDINYLQRKGRQTIIVTSSKNYYQNISINNIKGLLPSSFVSTNKGVLVNMNNVSKIDWNNLVVYFKDGSQDYLISYTHKKELLKYGEY